MTHMNPRIPSFYRVLQHALIGAMATVYLVAAGVQIYRGNYMTALMNLVITAVLGVILEFGKERYGKFFANFSMRMRVSRVQHDESCVWCGETIEAATPAIAHRGAMDGRPFKLHQHVECEGAAKLWYEAQVAKGVRDVKVPPAGSMQRGRSRPRQDR